MTIVPDENSCYGHCWGNFISLNDRIVNFMVHFNILYLYYTQQLQWSELTTLIQTPTLVCPGSTYVNKTSFGPVS